MSDPQVARSPSDLQWLWTFIVGVPLFISVLRLWVESGGSLHTTLLLLGSIDPVNMFTALVVTGSWLASALFVAVFAVGTVGSARPGADPADAPAPPPVFARWTDRAPLAVRVAAFVVALFTWQLLYLPLLLMAACAVFRPYWRVSLRLTGWLGAGVYLAAFGPTAWDAARGGYLLPTLIMGLPPILVALGATEPLPAFATRPFNRIGQTFTVILVGWAALPVVATPVMPLSVVTVQEENASTPGLVRGNIVEVDDRTTTVLREGGGVDFIPNELISTRSLCPDANEAPRYRLWVRQFHVEDSLLRGLGRARRPATFVDARCRPTVPQREPGQDFPAEKAAG